MGCVAFALAGKYRQSKILGQYNPAVVETLDKIEVGSIS
jgi:hypothetical protein